MRNRRLPKLDLNITNKCNFRCAHCAFDSGIMQIPEFTTKELERILIETKALGGKRFDITGGEPLVRKDVGKIISIGKNLDYKIELVTNGSLLNKEKLRNFKELGLDGIAISLDGSNSELYNRIRKKDSETFYKILKNIKESKETGFYTKVNTVVFSHNLEDIVNITELALTLGADEHGIYYFTPIGRGNRSSELAVEPIKWLNYVKSNLKKYQDSKTKVSFELPLIEKEAWNSNLGCVANNEKSHLQILPNGDVFPCAILASYNKPIANLHNHPVEYIWDNDKLWKNYWGEISSVFGSLGGYCVNFKDAFNINSYDTQKYNFVCPIRKFELGDIK